MTLKMFSNNDHELIIAYSAEDAISIWNNTTGDDYIKDNYGPLSNWQPYDDDKLVSITSVDEKYEWLISENASLPNGATVKKGHRRPVITATAKAWVDHAGRCYFAGDE